MREGVGQGGRSSTSRSAKAPRLHIAVAALLHREAVPYNMVPVSPFTIHHSRITNTMSTLYLVRHGQASFMSDNYDQLSALGEKQGHRLGEYWAKLGLVFSRVYVGPLQRHRQTEAAVASIYRAEGLPWPEPQYLPELSEHQGMEVVNYALSELGQSNPIIAELARDLQQKGNNRRLYLKAFRQIMQMWVRQEINPDEFESWRAFRARVEAGMKKIMHNDSGSDIIAVFSSGGPVGAATAFALDLSDEQALQLSWVVRNAAYNEFRLFATRFMLLSFNSASHFQEPELVTYI